MKKNIKILLRKVIEFLQKHVSKKNEDFPYYLLIFIALFVFVIALNIFVELTDEIIESSSTIFDEKVTDFVLSFRSHELTDFFRIITDFGDFYAYLVMTILVSVYLFTKFRNWKFILQLLAVTALSSLSNLALKRFIGRARPGIEHLVSVETLSYPSGHSASAMAFYGFLTYLIFQLKMPKWIRWPLCILFVLLIGLIGLSRIYLGVHFPTDVLGGFMAGLIWVAFCIVLFNIIVLFRRKKSRKKSNENILEN